MKKLPFSKEQMERIVKEYPTPFHIYDEKAIRENIRELYKAFSWNKGFKEYFAVKALPNPAIPDAATRYLSGIFVRTASVSMAFASASSNASQTMSALRRSSAALSSVR